MTVVSLKLEQYKKAEDLCGFAQILHLKPAQVSYAIYKLDKPGYPKKYDEFTIPKRSGGERSIKAPHDALKAIQKRLAEDLMLIEQELEAKRIEKRNCILAHGFKKKLSIITNGERHRHQRYVFNLDLKDFFPSINFGRVYGYFSKNKDFALNSKVAALIASIACHDNQLPQGSPCSPVISNLIAAVLDVRLNKLARSHNCTYTRYADDITFSTAERLFPKAIGIQAAGSNNLWEIGPKLLTIITKAGFQPNPAKTRMQLYFSRQDVTGVVVNKKINVPATYYAAVAAMCHNLFMNGKCHINVGEKKQPLSVSKLRGRLAYIYQIRGKGPIIVKNPEDGDAPEKNKAKFWASFKLFQQFLDYADLYGAQRPVLLCEGVTDNIYIKCAIQSLATTYPALITAGGELKVKLFKYTNSSAAVQQLSGGTGELLKLLNTYSTRTKRFKSRSKHPLIIVVDSDDGSKSIFKEVEKRSGAKIGSQPWFHIGSNLYVVPIPKVDGTDTPIERLFEKALLDKPYEGKKFNPSNADKDAAKFFDKKVFATKVVAANKASINFSGFNDLLTAITQAIADYHAKVSGAHPAPTANAIAATPT